MVATIQQRTFIHLLPEFAHQPVRLRGWVYRLRALGKTTFIVLRDCSGEAQCVAATEAVRGHHLKVEDAIEIEGEVRPEERAKSGYEIEIHNVRVLNRAAQNLPSPRLQISNRSDWRR